MDSLKFVVEVPDFQKMKHVEVTGDNDMEAMEIDEYLEKCAKEKGVVPLELRLLLDQSDEIEKPLNGNPPPIVTFPTKMHWRNLADNEQWCTRGILVSHCQLLHLFAGCPNEVAVLPSLSVEDEQNPVGKYRIKKHHRICYAIGVGQSHFILMVAFVNTMKLLIADGFKNTAADVKNQEKRCSLRNWHKKLAKMFLNSFAVVQEEEEGESGTEHNINDQKPTFSLFSELDKESRNWPLMPKKEPNRLWECHLAHDAIRQEDGHSCGILAVANVHRFIYQEPRQGVLKPLPDMSAAETRKTVIEMFIFFVDTLSKQKMVYGKVKSKNGRPRTRQSTRNQAS